MGNKIDSNATGLRYAEESDLKTLLGTEVWYPLEPNSYKDFGGQLSLTAREPINASRQRKKGVITDLEASGGFASDLTATNIKRLMQGFFFADIREKATTAKMNSASIPVTAVDGTGETYAVDNDPSLGFLVNHLVLASGFGVNANNGVKKLTAVAAGLLTTTGLDDEAGPPATAKLEAVGYEFAADSLDVVIVSGNPRLNRGAGVVDFTTLGLVRGEWIYVGGDAVGNTYANNAGWARVGSVAAAYIELDKTAWTPQAELGTGKSIRIFFGSVLKNESTSALIKRRSYQLERTLGEDGVGVQSEYLTGAIPNEFTLDAKSADKVTCELSFVALDHETRTGTVGVKAGTRPSLVSENAFNTSSDFSRIRLAKVVAGAPAQAALFAFATELKLEVKNNVSPNKAIGTLGAIDAVAGNFEVGGSLTVYFATTDAIASIKDNSDITLDMVMARSNVGIAIDVPLLALGDGRANVEKDQAITLPLNVAAAESAFGHTLLMSFFAYLPNAAC